MRSRLVSLIFHILPELILLALFVRDLRKALGEE